MAPTDEQPGRTGLIGRTIAACAANPVFTVLVVVALSLGGVLALKNAPLDAIPDLSDTQVIILTEWPGRSPDLVEDQITYPLSSALISAPRIKFVRGQSFFGLSFVYAIFEDGTDIYWARSRVLEYLATAGAALPEGVEPTLGPDATGVGWVFQYALTDRTGRHDLAELRALQDWNVRYALASVPGVAEVASVGGFERQYQVEVDPRRLRAHGVNLGQVLEAVRASNQDSGGGVIEIAGHEHMIRGRGYLRSVEDLADVPVAVGEGGVPITVAQLGEVSLGPAPRRGIADLNGEGEVVGGIVVMRYGENALEVIEGVKERIDAVRRGLPEGVELIVTYDRSELIEGAVSTLRRTLIEEMLIVAVIILLFLLHVRSALVPLLTLPLAVVLAFIPLYLQGLTANIMSLGGIAVAIGAMVDAAIIILENVHKKLEAWQASGSGRSRTAVIVDAMQEVGPSIFFSLLVITVSFLPVFTLEATEGRLFRPLAFTKTYSMAFSALLAITLTPALVVLLVRGPVKREEDHPLSRILIASYAPVVRFVVRFRGWVVAAALLLMAVTVPAFLALGSEFMPPLHEGAILYMPASPPGMSMTEAGNALQVMDQKLRAFPEVESVFGKMGRATTATDPAPIDMAEVTVVLKPKDAWREGLTFEVLLEEMNAELQIPGMPNLWWMPIQTRTEMLATGIRSPLAVQVYGDDLETIESKAIAIEKALLGVPGTRSAFAERSTGGFFVDLEVNRQAAARYGVRVRDVSLAIESAIGGQVITEVVDGRARFPVSVRYARDFREDPERLDDVLVTTATGAQIPLSEVATLRFTHGAPMVRSEDGRLVGFVFVDPGEVPIADYVATARRAIDEQIDLAGVHLAFTGQYQHLERAAERLAFIVPLTLLLVLLLLYLNTRSLVESLIVLLAVPFSLVGAVWLLFFLDYNLSVAVWVGLIALAGLDAETGVVMLLYLTLAHRRAQEERRLTSKDALTEVIVEGAARRVRPKLMTVITTMLALFPVLWSTGTGADVMKRIAAPMVGGLVTSFALELLVYPALFAIWQGRGLPQTQSSAPPADDSPQAGGGTDEVSAKPST